MFRNFFLPHPKTHKKAHLISWQAFLVYSLLFLGLRFGITTLNSSHPGILGISSNVDQKELIELTNKERTSHGLSALKENDKLDQAALEKAKNMFAEDYWAHYSPSGKNPWGFIEGAGYKFIYAGENLARNFYTSQEVVAAWMNSPSHRANLLNNHYQEIGIAVLQGTLKGQLTTLVVQEFGTPVNNLAVVPTSNQPELPKTLPAEASNVLPVQTNLIGALRLGPLDPYFMIKSLGFTIIGLLSILILVDMYVMSQRMVIRVSSRHIPHLIFLGVTASALMTMHPGAIL